MGKGIVYMIRYKLPFLLLQNKFFIEFSEAKQFLTCIEANKELKLGLNFGYIGAFDIGDLYYDSFGLLLRLSKSF
jgi:hypothetical protein